MRAVPVKSADQQAAAMVLSVRELLVRQRTQLVNALRGHAAEFGIIAAKGLANTAALLERAAADPAVPEAAQAMLAFLGSQVAALDARLAELDRQLAARHKANPLSQQLAAVPGIGPLSALALTVDAAQFRSGRHFAACWPLAPGLDPAADAREQLAAAPVRPPGVGLMPKEHSTGGKQHLVGISRAGNERLRQLLVLGATAVIKVAKPGNKHATPWLTSLLARRPRKVAAVALANTGSHRACAMGSRGWPASRGP